MTSAMCFATEGVRLRKDLESTKLCSTIGALYSKEENPGSTILKRFHLLLPHIAKVTTPPSTHNNERVRKLLHKTSTLRARSYIKKFCAMQLDEELYAHVQAKCPEHLKHMPNMLLPHTSTPIGGMSRSNQANRLRDWNMDYTVLRKLRVPLYPPDNCPRCWYGKTHDC